MINKKKKIFVNFVFFVFFVLKNNQGKK